MKINTYPDGTSYVEVPDLEPYISYDMFSVFRVNNYEDLWHLTQLVDAWNNIGIIPEITIPNLIDAQADRRFAENQSSGLKLVCKHLNDLNAAFKIFHPHNPEVVEALIDEVEIIDNSEFIDQVLYNLHLSKVDNPILMSSDAGGFKPLMKLCDKLNWQGETASASKSRSYENGKTTLHQLVPISDFNGKDVLIIDDICVYGGTFIGLSKLLKERNIGRLYLAVSHMTIQNFKSSELFDCFDGVFTTNSKYDNYFVPDSKGELYQLKNLKVINLF